jgi:hypothetical protein
MLNKILPYLTLISLLSSVASLVFWSDDANPSIFTDGVVMALAATTVVLVVITNVRLYSSSFNNGGVSVFSSEAATQAPRNADIKPAAYITIALAIIAPFIPYLGTTLAWSASQSAS